MLPRPQYTPLQQQMIEETIERRKRMSVQVPEPVRSSEPIPLPSLPKRPPMDLPNFMAVIPEIQKIVCNYLNIDLEGLLGTSQKNTYVRPRQLAMHLCRELTNKSASEIARRFNRDHTTVLSATKQARILLRDDPIFSKVTEQIREILQRELGHRLRGAFND